MAVRPGRDIKGPVVTTGNPDTVNDAPITVTTVGSAYDLSGQLGALVRSADGQKEWVYVKFSSTSTGTTPAINQPLYWIGNSTANLATAGAWVVDNNTTANTGASIGDLAGVLRVVATRGNYIYALRKSGTVAVPIIGTTATLGVPGDPVIGSTTSSASVAVISSTSTVLGAPVIIGRSRFGVLASTSTAGAFVGSTTTSAMGVNYAVFLDVE